MDCSHQAPLSLGLSPQEYLSGVTFPPPRDLPDPGIEPTSLKSSALSCRFFTTSTTWEAHEGYWRLDKKSFDGVSGDQSLIRVDSRGNERRGIGHTSSVRTGSSKSVNFIKKFIS